MWQEYWNIIVYRIFIPYFIFMIALVMYASEYAGTFSDMNSIRGDNELNE